MNQTILKTKEERDAAFATVFANIIPADQRAPTVKERLEPYREQLVQKRKEGFSLKQIADAIKQEPIALNVSAVTLAKFLGPKSKKRRKTKALVMLNPIIPLQSAGRPGR